MLFAVLAIQPFLWDGPLAATTNGRPRTASLSRSSTTRSSGAAGAMIVAALALLVATGVGNRWFAAGRGIARLTCDHRDRLRGLDQVHRARHGAAEQRRPNPLSWLLLLVFIMVPFSLTGSQARRTLALC